MERRRVVEHQPQGLGLRNRIGKVSEVIPAHALPTSGFMWRQRLASFRSRPCWGASSAKSSGDRRGSCLPPSASPQHRERPQRHLGRGGRDGEALSPTFLTFSAGLRQTTHPSSTGVSGS